MTSPENYWDQSCSFIELFCLLLLRDANRCPPLDSLGEHSTTRQRPGLLIVFFRAFQLSCTSQ